jgi:prostaglandin-endoperoxide synthase 2
MDYSTAPAPTTAYDTGSNAAAAARDTSRDGFKNKLEYYALTHFAPLWRCVGRTRWLSKKVNSILVNSAVNKTRSRPHPFSTRSQYTSWESLTDRAWSSRHLPACTPADLPDIKAVAALFRRPAGQARFSPKSTYLFPCFAQWFTDGFLRTDDNDRRMNTSNHEIDMCALYGLRKQNTLALRLMSEERGKRGRLKSQMIGDEEYPLFLFEDDGATIKPEFASLGLPLRFAKNWPAEKARTIFAVGGDRVNSSPQTAMLNTLFMREHNRICGLLEAKNPSWDDERVFQTARNIVIALLIKIVVEEYINHISPYHFRFAADPSAAWDARWCRPNWIAVEFNLLYRWHSLVPDQLHWRGRDVATEELSLDNRSLIDVGLARAFDMTSRQTACEVGMFNTPNFLLHAEEMSIQQGRINQLATYNDYREAMSYPRVTAFEQISGDPRVVEGLRSLYKTPDRVEYYVGLFAEDTRLNATVPALIGRMVGVDAFSQALTNPLLSRHVFHEGTFDKIGFETIGETRSLRDIVVRNVRSVPDDLLVVMTRPGWTYARA